MNVHHFLTANNLILFEVEILKMEQQVVNPKDFVENLAPSRPTNYTSIKEDTPLVLSDRDGTDGSVQTVFMSSKRRKSSQFHQSFRRFRSATMTISLLEKPSIDRNASALLAGWNVTNLIQGTGILGVPYAVRMGGWASVASIAVVAMICCFTGKLLVDCLYEVSKTTGQKKRVRVNYPEVGEAAWPGWGNKIVSLVQVCEMFGGVIMYIVLLATVFFDITSGLTPLNTYEWAVVCSVIALPTVFITRVSIISWISMISVFALMSCILTILVYCFWEFKHMSISNIPPFEPSYFPVGFGIIVFSYTAHAVFPGVEGCMKEPKKFPRMMNVAFAFAASTKVLLGLLAVMRFGVDTDQVITVNITVKVFNTLASILVVINVLLAFPICMFVVSETWDTKMLPYFPHLQKESKYHWFWLVLTRTLLVTLGLFLAVVVPHFGLLMGLVGSFTGSCLCFVFPCVFHLKLKWKELKWYSVAIRIFVIVFGLIAGGFGLWFSGRELAKSYAKNN